MGVGIIVQISAKIMVWKIFVPLSKQIISAKSLQEVGQSNTKNYGLNYPKYIIELNLVKTGEVVKK